ncbi:MAG: YbfB/YjiJ family MFS transporter [Sneathiella sp.]|nr:YbfB/YjiJ family MFS transporter [Sneathiella sp.]
MSSQTSIVRITVIGAITLALAMGIGRFAFTPLLPMMQEDGLLNIMDGGYLASIHLLGYWLGAVFAAKISWPPKAMLRISLLAIAFGTMGMGLTDNFTVWMILRWICGVCSAWSLVLVSNYYVKYLADINRSAYQGWVFSGVGLGIAIIGLGYLAFMANEIDSSHSWLITGGISFLAICALCLSMGPEIPNEKPAINPQETKRSPLNWRLIAAYGAMGIGYIIPASYLPVMAREIIESPFVFGWAWPIFGAAAFISTILASRFQKRYSNRQIWAVSQLVMAAGLILPAVYPHILTILIGGICVGGTFMIITMTGMKEMHRVAPPQDVMRHIAVMTASFATGQMIGPLFASFVYELTQSFTASLIFASVILVLTTAMLIERSPKRKIVRL